MEIWAIWLIIAAVMVIVEIMFQSVWTLCLAVGCLCGAIADAFDMELVWQIVIMAVCSVAAFPALLPLFNKWHRRSLPQRDLRTGMDALLGRRGVVIDEIKPGKLGRIRIDGDRWQARMPDIQETVGRGVEVVVTAYDSIVLTVSLASERE
ncbi:MAG: NfeD family protein [Clostridium sp.]|nr:NfeD family protein [Prevotella sp.]MCM1428858.1 NfeD family protein [Clostridium sp.]MCM1475237.1 NfeD family protein [Muribaculaceae bacterium]